MCFHTVAVTGDTGISFAFCTEIKKNINSKGKKNKRLTKALELDLKDKEKGKRQGERNEAS